MLFVSIVGFGLYISMCGLPAFSHDTATYT